jgi:hypothetical protein
MLPFFVALGLVLSVAACTKQDNPVPSSNTTPAPQTPSTPSVPTTPTTPVDPYAGYTAYRIRTGNNYCDGNTYPMGTFKKLQFKVIFDSSCIYTNVDPGNQADINKLYGFADSGSFHQQNSARFGWNWQGGKMHIHAYCYVHGERQYKELGTVPLGAAQDCSLEVLPGKYIFTLNGKRDTVTRGCTEDMARGYKLFPYFGGDETAPHDVVIRIKDIQ